MQIISHYAHSRHACSKLRNNLVIIYYSERLLIGCHSWFCNSMAVAGPSQYSLADIAEIIFTEASVRGRLKTIRWLQARSLLATQMTCTCATSMNLVERDLHRGNQDDKWAWKCPNCTNVKSIRSGSWFESKS